MHSIFNFESATTRAPANEIIPLAGVRIILLMMSLIVLSEKTLSQNRPVSFSRIDWEVQSINAATVDSLSHKLVRNYSTEMEKVRAIFSWITQHISYNTYIFNSSRRYGVSKFIPEPTDTISDWKSANEMTAQRVIQRRFAVCDGYAKLFKTLCDYAGIRSELVTGYAKCNTERAEKFKSNHTWNVVMIDSSWRLLDVTWASGFVNYSNEFVQRLDETYFLSDPKRFIIDHYPEDLRWTLLEEPPGLREFRFTPFRTKSFVKYQLNIASPKNGWIEAAVGDTVHIELQTRDARKDSKISPDPFFDSVTFTLSPASCFLQPLVSGNNIHYDYIVKDDHVEWIHLLYNDDVILRYRLSVKEEKSKFKVESSKSATVLKNSLSNSKFKVQSSNSVPMVETSPTKF